MAVLHLADEAATAALGARLADSLEAGSVVFLHGDLGAGKSSLARAAILARIGGGQAVPSPTFTLIQDYEADDLRLVHTDLYRLADADEIAELGLDAAFEEAAVLVEWPERLGSTVPADRLDIHLEISKAGGRDVTLTATGPKGRDLCDAAMRGRDSLIAAFIDHAGWGTAEVAPLAGDASNRRYLRLSRAREVAVLMDAPIEKGEDVRPFAEMTQALRGRRLSAPEILASNPAHGFLLLEDLGDAIYARICERDPGMEEPIYAAAVDLLSGLQVDAGDDVPPYDAEVLEREAALLVDWWVPAAGGTTSDDLRAEYLAILAEATRTVEQDRSALVLRDFHAENLIWLPEREGAARVGLLDYQDALIGHPAYDLVSLLEDARRDLTPGLAEAMVKRFLAARPDLDPDEFRAAYDVLGAQRNAKILGIFARLCRRDGKPHYIDMIPRVWDHFQRDLTAPALAPLRRFVDAHVPTPTEETLARARG